MAQLLRTSAPAQEKVVPRRAGRMPTRAYPTAPYFSRFIFLVTKSINFYDYRPECIPRYWHQLVFLLSRRVSFRAAKPSESSFTPLLSLLGQSARVSRGGGATLVTSQLGEVMAATKDHDCERFQCDKYQH
ncbi:hypothetical protein EVAR_60807_1 [Eumeta japonica]|uniref:Uncharacterized protein n=1 Tax=Eumeta variegata TaxID=151549 RepID=A0A4C1YJF4_EUMVA|nr:hypothetical protein EVAR_60807_1 [Eumeta japonica]